MRILLITSDVPATSSMPGSPRGFSLLRHVAAYHEIHLATFVSSVDRYEAFVADGEPSRIFRSITSLRVPQAMSFWGRQRHRLVQAPYFVTSYRSRDEFRDVRRRMSELIQHHKPDLLYADGLPAAQYILEFRAIPRVIDAHDAVSLNFRRAVPYANSRLRKVRLLLESLSVRRFERAAVRLADAYLVNSQTDWEVLQAYDRDMKVQCIANGVDTEYFAPDGDASDARTVVFTGVMGYAPNRDATRFLCADIIPRVKRVVPDVQVQLVGSDPPDDVRALAGKGVTVTGTVPDVRPFIHRAAVYVSPLRFGTGMKNKILAALAMGKAVVASPESCAGLDVESGKHLLVAESSEEFAADIVTLLGDPDRRRNLGVAARKLVLQRYGWPVMAQQLESLLERLLLPCKQSRLALDKSLSRGPRGN